MFLASAVWRSLCFSLYQNMINLFINESGCSGMCFKVCRIVSPVPAFGGLSVKVIILIHLRRLQSFSSKQLYYSWCAVHRWHSLGAGMPVFVSSRTVCMCVCGSVGVFAGCVETRVRKQVPRGIGCAKPRWVGLVCVLSCWGGGTSLYVCVCVYVKEHAVFHLQSVMLPPTSP